MSEPLIKENKKSSLLTRILIGALVVVTVAALGFIAYKFFSYKGSGGIPIDTAFAQVAISSPPQGVQLEVSESVMVEAAAIGSNPFASMELWINGELLGVQAASSGGVLPFSTFFSWRPVEPGVYSLIAEAIDIDGNIEISTQVIVFVVQTEIGIELLISDSPTVLPAPSGGGYSPPAIPQPDDNIGPASSWSPSVGDWVTSLMVEVKPSAPELIVSAGECEADLQIHDLSDNEEGFAVYRQTGISPMWVKVATLSSQSELDWITYVDEGIYGAVNYYVTAFNSKGEVKSNLVMVSIDPTDCVSENEEIAVGTLGVMLQIPNLKAENVYCYKSTDGIYWDRWPIFGFLIPGGGGYGGLMVDMAGGEQEDEEGTRIGGPIMQFSLKNIAGEAVSPQMDIFMECWGWEGSELEFLGKIATKGIKPQADKSQTILGEGLIAELITETAVIPGQSDFYPIEFGWGESTTPDQIEALSPISLEVPRVILRETTDYDICRYHLPLWMSAFNKDKICKYKLSYTLGALVERYLVWNFDTEPVCEGGLSVQCKSYSELKNLAIKTKGEVGFDVISVSGGVTTSWKVTRSNLTAFLVPPLPCAEDAYFSVRFWYRPGNGVFESNISADQEAQIGEIGDFKKEIYYGPFSNWVTIPCEIDRTEYIDIKFRMNLSVDFFDYRWVNYDGFIELYGYFFVVSPNKGHHYLLFGETNIGFDKFFLFMPPISSSNWYPVDLHTIDLCQSTNGYNCDTAYYYGNDTIRGVPVNHGDGLVVGMKLIRYVGGVFDHEVCEGIAFVPGKRIGEWRTKEWGGNIYDNYHEHGYAERCRVTFRIIPANGP